MLLVSDIHGAFGALARVAAAGETLLVLGDLINFVDYRTTDGIMAEIFGSAFVAQVAAARGRGDLDTNRRLWIRHTAGREDEIRARVAELVAAQYERCRQALAPARGFVTYGNVDWPDVLRAILPPGCRFVDGEAVEIEGTTFGFVGGGAPTVIGARGEVSDDLMESKLARIGDVEVLCSHLPPAVPPLHTDVVTGFAERASMPLLDYLRRVRPRYHYFGDVHQPQATTWRVGATRCINVGYFRATGRPVRHTTSGFQPGGE
jgi:Icc-related predicted phosphoesterase